MLGASLALAPSSLDLSVFQEVSLKVIPFERIGCVCRALPASTGLSVIEYENNVGCATAVLVIALTHGVCVASAR